MDDFTSTPTDGGIRSDKVVFPYATDPGRAIGPVMGRDLYQAVTDRIVAALETGHIPWKPPFSGYGKQALHGNIVTGSTYTGINQLLCWIEAQINDWSSTRWVTMRWLFEEGKKKGVRLRRKPDAPAGKTGQTATLVVYYGKFEREVETPEGEPDTVEGRFLKAYRVFNLDQLENVPDEWIDEPQPAPDLKVQRAEVDDWIDRTGARFIVGGNTASYNFSKDEIRIPHYLRFVHGQEGHLIRAVAQFNAARFHELIHWTGASDRLNRLQDIKRGTTAYAKEELVAEIGAAFLSARFGYDTFVSHVSYLGEWLKMLKNDRRLVVHASSAASKAVDFLDNLQQKAAS